MSSSIYACQDHPYLHPDAWSAVVQGVPQGEGLDALLVCQFRCPSRDTCPVGSTGAEIIGNGGWFTAQGVYTAPPKSDMISVVQAATFLGIDKYTVERLIRKYKWEVVYHLARRWVHIKDVESVKDKFGPKHGTAERWRLHILQGSDPCRMCVNVMSESVALV